MTLQELAEAFLAANQNRLRPNTHRAYGYDLGMLAREFPDVAAEVITVAHLRAFLQATAELTPSTLARRQATLRSCFAWAYRNDLLPSDPTVKLEPVDQFRAFTNLGSRWWTPRKSDSRTVPSRWYPAAS